MASLSRWLLPLLLFLTLLAQASCAPAVDTERGVAVVRVVDGDTIVIAGKEKVRYIGIDTPERGQPYYKEATDFNRQLVAGRRVRLERDVSERDRYGRLLRYVYVDNTFVNEELVKQGLARALVYPPDNKYQHLFATLEKEARAAGRGMWQR